MYSDNNIVVGMDCPDIWPFSYQISSLIFNLGYGLAGYPDTRYPAVYQIQYPVESLVVFVINFGLFLLLLKTTTLPESAYF